MTGFWHDIGLITSIMTLPLKCHWHGTGCDTGCSTGYVTLGMTLCIALGKTLGIHNSGADTRHDTGHDTRTLGTTLCITPDMTLGMTLNMTLVMTLGMTYFYLHFWHMYLPSAVALTLSLHSWHKARPKTKKKNMYIFQDIKLFEIMFNIYFLPWFFMKPKSANSLWHISQQKHLGCQEAIIALMTLPTMNSPEKYFKKMFEWFFEYE